VGRVHQQRDVAYARVDDLQNPRAASFTRERLEDRDRGGGRQACQELARFLEGRIGFGALAEGFVSLKGDRVSAS